jgi:hypothetical protein
MNPSSRITPPRRVIPAARQRPGRDYRQVDAAQLLYARSAQLGDQAHTRLDTAPHICRGWPTHQARAPQSQAGLWRHLWTNEYA